MTKLCVKCNQMGERESLQGESICWLKGGSHILLPLFQIIKGDGSNKMYKMWKRAKRGFMQRLHGKNGKTEQAQKKKS